METVKVGRPSTYSEKMSLAICSRLAMGESLRKICVDKDMPCWKTIFNWINTKPEFLQQYERAKEQGCEAMAEEMIDIAEDETKEVQRSRLMVDTRKWYLSKIKAKKYGEKIDTTVTHKFDDLSDEELDARIKELEDKVG